MFWAEFGSADPLKPLTVFVTALADTKIDPNIFGIGKKKNGRSSSGCEKKVSMLIFRLDNQV